MSDLANRILKFSATKIIKNVFLKMYPVLLPDANLYSETVINVSKENVSFPENIF